MRRNFNIFSAISVDSVDFVHDFSRRGTERRNGREKVKEATIMKEYDKNDFREIKGEEEVTDLSVEGFLLDLKKYEDEKKKKSRKKKDKSAGFSNLKNFCTPPQFLTDRLMDDDLTHIIPFEEYTNRLNSLKECISKRTESLKFKKTWSEEEADNPMNSNRTKNFEFVIYHIIGKNSDGEMSNKDVFDMIEQNLLLLTFDYNAMCICDYAAFVGNKKFLQGLRLHFPSHFNVNRKLSLSDIDNVAHFPLLRDNNDERYVIRGDTLLHISTRNGHYDVVKLLLEEIDELDLTIQNSFGQCAYEVESRTRASFCCRNLILKKVKLQLQSRIDKLEEEVSDVTLFNTLVDRVLNHVDLPNFLHSFDEIFRSSEEGGGGGGGIERWKRNDNNSDSFLHFSMNLKACLKEND